MRARKKKARRRDGGGRRSFAMHGHRGCMHPAPFSHRFTWKNLKGRFFTVGAAKLILMNIKLPSFYVPSCCKERGVRCVRRKEKEKLEPPLSRANSTAISSKRIRITDLIFIAFNLFSRPPILRSLISRGRKKCVVDSR